MSDIQLRHIEAVSNLAAADALRKVLDWRAEGRIEVRAHV